MTDDDLIEGYLRSLRLREMSPNTIRRRNDSLGAFAKACGGLATATPEDVEDFLLARQAPATRRAYFMDIKQFYRWANRRGRLDIDPTNVLDAPRVPKRLPSPLSDEEVDRLLASLEPGSVYERMICLGLFAGLRVGDIAKLRTDDLDFERRTIRIRSGKGGKSAVLPMSERLAEVLAHAPPGLVVEGRSSKGVSAAIRRLLRRLDIEARPHDLRHTFGTRAAVATNGNLVAVAQLMRHENYATSQGYIDWAPNTAPIVDQLYSANGY